MRITPQEEKEFKDKICNIITEYKNKNGEAPTYKDIADIIEQPKQRVYAKITKMISAGELSEDDIRKERNRLKRKTTIEDSDEHIKGIEVTDTETTDRYKSDKSIYDGSITYEQDIQIKCNNMSEVLNLFSKMLKDKVMKPNNNLVNAVNISVNKLRQSKAIYFVIHNGYINISSKENKEIKVTEAIDFC